MAILLGVSSLVAVFIGLGCGFVGFGAGIGITYLIFSRKIGKTKSS